MVKANILGLDGTIKEEVKLPLVFQTEYKPTLIKRAAHALQTTKKQPKGANPRAGKMNTARYQGYRGVPTKHRTINVGKARLPRMTNKGGVLYGKVASVPQAVGGPAAHPLKAWERTIEEINKKERRLALDSAIAATIDLNLVEKRFIVEKELPIIVEDKIESLSKTSEVVSVLNKVGVGKDLVNAKNKVRKRAGKGKARGRVWKQKKSVLVVTGKNSPLLRASRNLPGVDAVTVRALNVDLLAPGAEAGRLVVWSKSAIVELEKKNSKKQVVKEETKKVSEKK